MRSRARWRELLGVLGGLVDLGHLGVLDQVVDGLGATDGLADSRHAAIGDELSLGSLDVLDASLLELGVDVVLGDLNLELTGKGVQSQGLAGWSSPVLASLLSLALLSFCLPQAIRLMAMTSVSSMAIIFFMGCTSFLLSYGSGMPEY